MRALLAVALLVFVSGALAGGKEKQEMLMWMKMKAMEGCLGKRRVIFDFRRRLLLHSLL